MSEQNPEANLDIQDFRERVKRITTPTLERGLSRWSLTEEVDEYNASLAAAKTPEERRAIEAELMGSEDETRQVLDDPDWEAQQELQANAAKTPEFLSTPEKVRIAQEELASRRDQELSKGEAASALAKPQGPPNLEDRIGKPTGIDRRSKRTPIDDKRREIVKSVARKGGDVYDKCTALDLENVPLTKGPKWASYRSWSSAYRYGGKTHQAQIRTRFWKDENA